MSVRHPMGIVLVVLSILIVGTWLVVPLAAADELKIDGLSADPQAFKNQVQQILGKADAMIKKLRDNQAAQAVVLDLIQTRDNIQRELLKAEATPDGAKWTKKEGRASIEEMLKLLKVQYERASAI